MHMIDNQLRVFRFHLKIPVYVGDFVIFIHLLSCSGYFLYGSGFVTWMFFQLQNYTNSRASLCPQNSLNSLCHGFHKMLKTFRWEHVGRIASRNFCIFMLQISHSTTCQRCFIGFRSDDWEGHWRTLKSLSCSWNQFQMTFALWHGALSCLK